MHHLSLAATSARRLVRSVASRATLLALVASAMVAGPFLLAQSATIGHSPVADLNNDNGNFLTGMSSDKAYFVPFQFNTLGDYSLASVTLLLSGSGNPGNLSLLATSTLGTDYTVPIALTTFTATGTLSTTPTAFTFTASSSTTLSANTTYYLRVTGGNDTGFINWVKSSIASGGGGGGEGGSTGSGGETGSTFNEFGSLVPLTSSLDPGSTLSFREIQSGSGGVSALDYAVGSLGGISITANAVSAVPEPGTYAAIAGAVALGAAAIARRRRSGR